MDILDILDIITEGNTGQANQWRNAPYVSEGHDENGANVYRCDLCRTGWLGRAARTSHFNGKRHMRAHNRLRSIAESYAAGTSHLLLKGRVRSYNLQIQQIEYGPWKTQLKAFLFDYMNAAVRTEYQVFCVQMTNLIAKYKRLESQFLLELAIIKSSIVSSGLLNTFQDLREHQILDSSFNSHQFFHTVRSVCGSDVIVPLVHSFLYN